MVGVSERIEVGEGLGQGTMERAMVSSVNLSLHSVDKICNFYTKTLA